MNINPILVEVQVNGQVIKVALHEELVVEDYDQLNKHINAVSAQIAYWNKLYVDCADILRDAEDKFKVWMAQKKAALVGKYTSETSKEEGVIIANTEEYLQKLEELRKLKYYKEIIGIVKDSFIYKKDMLISLASNYRQELNSGIQINKNALKLQNQIIEQVQQSLENEEERFRTQI